MIDTAFEQNALLTPIRLWFKQCIPTLFSDQLSYYELVEQLAEQTQSIVEAVALYSTKAEIQAIVDSMNKDQADQATAWQAYTDKAIATCESTLRALIEGVENGIMGSMFDPTYGISPQPLENILNHIYDDTRYFAITCDQEASLGMSCDDLAGKGMTAKEHDLLGYKLFGVNPYVGNAGADMSQYITLAQATALFVKLQV